MNVPTHDELISRINQFLERHPAIGEARFGRDATGEPGLVARLRRGSSPTLNVLNRIGAYMAAKDGEAADHAVTDTIRSQPASAGIDGAASPEVTHA